MNYDPTKSFHSGFVAIVGRPNVGKSSLLNAILGERIAIATNKPQTTRNRILGVKHFEDGQIVYLDTPGIHKAKAGLNKYMMDTALASINDADIVYLMVEVGPKFINRPDLGEGNRFIIEKLSRAGKPVFLIINKVDLVPKGDLLPFIDRVKESHPFAEIFPISALKSDGVAELVEATRAHMPEGPPYYPGDMITDRTMRFLAAEIIREKLMIAMHDEVPYSIGVEIEQFLEGEGADDRYKIDARILVERDSQKGMVIGKGGQNLKKIGSAARKDMETYFRRKVYLKLFVRVDKNWTLNPARLRDLGYN